MASIALGYIMPLLSFFFVFTLVYALLAKTKVLGENTSIHFITSLLIAAMFVLSPLTTKFTVITIPWLAIFLTAVFFILLILTFVRGNIDDIVKSPVIAVILIVIVLIIFVVSAINVFGPLMSQAAFGTGKGDALEAISNSKFIGVAVLLVIAAVVSWQLTKK